MKAIETIYKGYRFRSRLEARWAVFYDMLNLKWDYEKEGYDMDGVRYLPDFFIDTGTGDAWPNESKSVLDIEFGSRCALIILGRLPFCWAKQHRHGLYEAADVLTERLAKCFVDPRPRLNLPSASGR